MGEAIPTTPQEAPEPQEQQIVWPDLDFELREQSVFGRNLPTNSDSRLRSLATAIHQAAPLSSAGLSGQAAVEMRTDTQKFLKGKVTISGRDAGREKLIDPESACTYVWLEKLVPVNHPIVQAWNKVYTWNTERLKHNEENPAKTVRTMTEAELDKLAFDLLASLGHTYIKDYYNEMISSIRKFVKG